MMTPEEELPDTAERPGHIRALDEDRSGDLLTHEQELERGRRIARAQAHLVDRLLEHAPAAAQLTTSAVMGSPGAPHYKRMLIATDDPSAQALVDEIRANEDAGTDDVRARIQAVRLNPERVHEMYNAIDDDAQATAAFRRWREAINSLVTPNLRLVARYAGQVDAEDLHIEDLFSEGVLGLGRAAERFDADRGMRFSTSAVWWIRQAINRAARSKRDAVRRPPPLYDNANRLFRVAAQLEQRYERPPTDYELAVASEMDQATVSHARNAYTRSISLDGDFEAPLQADPGGTPEQTCLADAEHEALHAIIANMPVELRSIITLAYGIGGRDAQPLQHDQIAERLSISRRKVRERIHAAQAWIREALGEQTRDQEPRKEMA